MILVSFACTYMLIGVIVAVQYLRIAHRDRTLFSFGVWFMATLAVFLWLPMLIFVLLRK